MITWCPVTNIIKMILNETFDVLIFFMPPNIHVPENILKMEKKWKPFLSIFMKTKLLSLWINQTGTIYYLHETRLETVLLP